MPAGPTTEPGSTGRSRAGRPGASASVRFAGAVQAVGAAGRAAGLAVPGYRTPPRVVGVHRTIRRSANGSALVSIRVEGRPWAAVLADVVDGVVAANDLTGGDAARARDILWNALEPHLTPVDSGSSSAA